MMLQSEPSWFMGIFFVYRLAKRYVDAEAGLVAFVRCNVCDAQDVCEMNCDWLIGNLLGSDERGRSSLISRFGNQCRLEFVLRDGGRQCPFMS